MAASASSMPSCRLWLRVSPTARANTTMPTACSHSSTTTPRWRCRQASSGRERPRGSSRQGRLAQGGRAGALHDARARVGVDLVELEDADPTAEPRAVALRAALSLEKAHAGPRLGAASKGAALPEDLGD